MTPLVKEKKLTEKQEAFLEALVTDAKGNIREAMKMAGYASTTKTAEVVSALREEIIEKASMVLAMKYACNIRSAWLITMVWSTSQIRTMTRSSRST